MFIIVDLTPLRIKKCGNDQILNPTENKSQQDARMFYSQLISGGLTLKPEKCEQMGI